MAKRVWHDDTRPPPEGWEWARTNDQAMVMLKQGGTEEISLDHDLGLEHLDHATDPTAIYQAGKSPNGSGLDLVRWMIEKNLVPAKVTIHSWNIEMGREMAATLNDAGYDCYISVYIPPDFLEVTL